MPTVVVRHKVGDFETWLKGHEDRVKIFAPARGQMPGNKLSYI